MVDLDPKWVAVLELRGDRPRRVVGGRCSRCARPMATVYEPLCSSKVWSDRWRCRRSLQRRA